MKKSIFVFLTILVCGSVQAETNSLSEGYDPLLMNPRVIEWYQMMSDIKKLKEPEQIERVNDFFNKKIRFASDMENWGTNDYWATPLEMLEKGYGDCEDYAIAKYVTLRNVDVNSNHLRLYFGRHQHNDHVVLAYDINFIENQYTNFNGEEKILDNISSVIKPLKDRQDLVLAWSVSLEGKAPDHNILDTKKRMNDVIAQNYITKYQIVKFKNDYESKLHFKSYATDGAINLAIRSMDYPNFHAF
jgi:predicted transglutaminase-like cysteine proteinase